MQLWTSLTFKRSLQLSKVTQSQSQFNTTTNNLWFKSMPVTSKSKKTFLTFLRTWLTKKMMCLSILNLTKISSCNLKSKIRKMRLRKSANFLNLYKTQYLRVLTYLGWTVKVTNKNCKIRQKVNWIRLEIWRR